MAKTQSIHKIDDVLKWIASNPKKTVRYFYDAKIVLYDILKTIKTVIGVQNG